MTSETISTLGNSFGGCGGSRSRAPACSSQAFLEQRSEQESQRDSGSKPRVARNELPWEMVPKNVPTLKGLWRCSSVVRGEAGAATLSGLNSPHPLADPG